MYSAVVHISDIVKEQILHACLNFSSTVVFQPFNRLSVEGLVSTSARHFSRTIVPPRAYEGSIGGCNILRRLGCVCTARNSTLWEIVPRRRKINSQHCLTWQGGNVCAVKFRSRRRWQRLRDLMRRDVEQLKTGRGSLERHRS